MTKLKLAAYLAAFFLGLLLGSKYTGAIKDSEISSIEQEHEKHLRLTAEANAEIILKQEKDNEDLMVRLSKVEQKGYEDLKDVKENTDRIITDLRDNNKRLSLLPSKTPNSCSGSEANNPKSTSVDDGTGERIDVHPRIAENLFQMSGRADQCSVKLTALQQWTKELLIKYGVKEND